RAELSVPPPTPVEKLLIDRVVIGWVQCHLADLDDLQRARSGTPQGFHAQRRLNGIQSRFLAAVKQLVVVRRLLKPGPSPLELLKIPVAETPGDNKVRHAGKSPSQPAAASAR